MAFEKQDLFDVAENGLQSDLGDFTQPKTIKRIYHQDPGHGWIAVKVAELVELGIADKITQCSYYRGGTAYLEEDQDATTYINAQKARGVTVEFDSRHTNGNSPIRSYQPFWLSKTGYWANL